jgi:hypothetical protein
MKLNRASEIGRAFKPGGVYFLKEFYPSLYQNFVTKHILLHPMENGSGVTI